MITSTLQKYQNKNVAVYGMGLTGHSTAKILKHDTDIHWIILGGGRKENWVRDKVKEYKKGKKGLIGLFMGEVMKLSKGKADPKLANQLLIRELEK